MKKIFFSVGEISADIHGARLIKELNSMNPDIYIGGMGGEKMKMVGANIEYDVTTMSSVGIIEYHDFYKDLENTRDNFLSLIQKEKPDLIIFMDMEGFNLDLAIRIKKLGLNIKTLYYITPQRWVLRIIGTLFVKKLAKYVDNIITSLNKEFEFYKKLGINANYFGNPIIDSINITKSKTEIRKKNSIPDDHKLIAILPGSRKQEIEKLTRIFLESAKIINRSIKSVFIIPVAHKIFLNKVKKNLENFKKNENIKIIVTEEKSQNIINASDFIILSSGSSTLECAILKKPMVICYKISYITYVLGKIFYRYKYIGLPNILLNENIVPELLQNKVNPENISQYVINILGDQEKKKYIKTKFEILKDSLSNKESVVNKVARYILQLIE
jgi:lipid-A-disaccharide synthase